MRWWILFALVWMVACGGEAEGEPETAAPLELPTMAATAATDLDAEGSPRQSPSEEEHGLPPTYTPVPTPARPDTPPTLAPGSTPDTPNQPNPAGQTTYTIQAGDTLAEIAAEYGVDLDDLAEANDITDIDRIEVGDVLVIP